VTEELPVTISLTAGEERSITLAGLGAAGYVWRWEIEGDPDVIAVSSERPEDVDQLPPGASADEVLTVRALRPGRGTLRLVQQRPWEKDAPPRAERGLEVTVTE